MRRLRASVAAALAALAALAPSCAGDPRTAGERPGDAAPGRVSVPGDLSAALVDVGGYRLAVPCAGRGRPAVVIEPGYA